MANYFGIQWPDPPDDEQRPYTPVPIQQQKAKAPAGIQGRFQPPVTPTVPTPPVYQQDRWESAPREVYPQDRWEAAPQAQPPMRDRWESAPTPPQRPYLPLVTQDGPRSEAMPPLVAAAPPVGGLPIVQAATRILPKLWEQRDEWADAVRDIVSGANAAPQARPAGRVTTTDPNAPSQMGQLFSKLMSNPFVDFNKLSEAQRGTNFGEDVREWVEQGKTAPLNLAFYPAMRLFETTGERPFTAIWTERNAPEEENAFPQERARLADLDRRLASTTDPNTIAGLRAERISVARDLARKQSGLRTERVLERGLFNVTPEEQAAYRRDAPMSLQLLTGLLYDPLNAFDALGPARDAYRVSRAAKELAPAYPTVKTAGGVLRPATSAEAKAATVAKLSKYNAVNQRLGPLAAFIPWRHTPQTMGEQLVNRTINATNRMLDGLPKTADGGIDLNLLQKAVADPHAPDIVAATAGYSQSAEWLDTAVVIDRALGVTPEATDAVATAQRAKIQQVEEQITATQKAIAETTAQLDNLKAQGKPAQQVNRTTNRLTKQQNSLANQQKHLDNLKAQVQQPGRVDFAGLIKLAQQPDSDSLTIAAELARQYADAAESFFPTTGKGLGRKLVNARDRFNNSILSTALLGTNPGYAFRNAANNLVTALVDGVNPYQSAEDLRQLWVRWGPPPVQTKQGIGPGDAFKNRATTAEYLQNLATPLRMRDTFKLNGRKWRDYTRAVAANWEAYASERIVAHHIQTYFPQTWGGYLKELRKQIVQAGQLDETQATQITRLWASKLNRTELHEAIDAMTGPSRPRVTPPTAPTAPGAAPTPPTAPSAPGWGTRPGAKKPYGTEPAPAPVLDLARTLSEDEAAQLVAEAGPGADTLARELLQAGPAAQRVFVDVLVPAQERSAQLAAHVNTLAGQTYTPGQRASLQQFLEDVQGVIETAKDNDDAMRQGVFEAAQNVTEAERTLIFREWRRARDTARRELYRRLDALEEARMPELGFDEQAVTNSRTHRQFIADAWARSDRVIENYWTGKGKGISQDYEAVNKERRRIWTDVQNRIKLRAEQWDADLDRAVAKGKGSAVTAAPEPPAPVEPEAPQPAQPNGMPMFISKARRQELYDLGYNKADVDAMTPAEGQAIAQAQRTKPAPVTAAPEPPAPVSAPSSVTREPWQMTQAELQQAIRIERLDDGTPHFVGEYRNPDIERYIAQVQQQTSPMGGGLGMGQRQFSYQDLEHIRDYAHRLSVAQAVADGKPVPANVLADYPDLAPAPVTAAPVGAEPPAPAPTAAQPVTAAPDANQISRINAKARELGIPSASDRNVGTGAQGAMWDQHALNIARQRFPGEIRPDSKAFRSLQKATPDELNLVEQALDERLAERAAPRVDVPPAAVPEVPPTAPDPRKPWETPSIRIERERRGTRLPVPGQPSTRVPFGKEPSAPAVGPSVPSSARERLLDLARQDGEYSNMLYTGGNRNGLPSVNDPIDGEIRRIRANVYRRLANGEPKVQVIDEGIAAAQAAARDFNARQERVWGATTRKTANVSPQGFMSETEAEMRIRHAGAMYDQMIGQAPAQAQPPAGPSRAAYATPAVTREAEFMGPYAPPAIVGDYEARALPPSVFETWDDLVLGYDRAPWQSPAMTTERALQPDDWQRYGVPERMSVPPTPPQVTPPSVAAPSKQPWEMTLEDWAKANKQDLNTQMNDIWREWQRQKLSGGRKTVPYETSKELYDKLKKDLLGDPGGARLVKVGHKEYVVADYEHKRMVADALASGQPVPPQVLADYPDLQRASGAGGMGANTVTAAMRDAFLADKPIMQRNKAKKILDTRINYGDDGGVMTRREFIERAYQKGVQPPTATIEIQGKRKADLSGYHVSNEWIVDDVAVTKTEVDYLRHLWDEGQRVTPPPAAAPQPGVTPPTGAGAPAAPAKKLTGAAKREAAFDTAKNNALERLQAEPGKAVYIWPHANIDGELVNTSDVIRQLQRDGLVVESPSLNYYRIVPEAEIVEPVFTRAEIVVGKPKTTRRKTAGGLSGTVVTDFEVSGITDEAKWARLDDPGRLNAFVLGNLNADGKPPKRTDKAWFIYSGKSYSGAQKSIIDSGLTYDEAVERAKDYIYQANPQPKAPELPVDTSPWPKPDEPGPTPLLTGEAYTPVERTLTEAEYDQTTQKLLAELDALDYTQTQPTYATRQRVSEINAALDELHYDDANPRAGYNTYLSMQDNMPQPARTSRQVTDRFLRPLNLGITAPGTQEAFAVMDAATAAARRVADFFTNRRVAAQPVTPLTPEQAAWLHQFADDFAAPKQMKAKAIASNIAVKMRNFALGDYADRRNIHEWLTWLYPYAYWYTFTYPNWARRIMQHPAILSNYARYKQAVREQNREYYRDMMNDPTAEPPEYWNYQLRIPLGDTSLYFNLERNLNPLVQLVESFKQTAKSAAPAFPWNAQTPEGERGFFQSGDFIQALGDFGPSISPPLIYAYALWLASQGYTEAAQQWVGGYLTPMSRLMRPVTAAIREAVPATGAVIPPGGWSPEMLILDFMKRGGDYWQQRSGIPAALVDLYRTNKATATEVENAAWSRDVWDSKWGDAAQANALKTLAPVFASWLLGQGFKPTDITDVQIQQMWDERDTLPTKRKNPDMAAEDIRAAWDAFRQKYPWYDVFQLARSQDPVERLDAFTDLVLDRLPPAGPQRQQALTDAGMPADLLSRYYDDGYSTAGFTPEERAQFELAIEKLAGTVDVPDAATQATYSAAGSERRDINAAAAAAIGMTLAAIQAIEGQYYDIKKTQGEDAAKAYLAQHPELKKFWNERTMLGLQGSTAYQQFYTDANDPYDKGRKEAIAKFGEARVREADAYVALTDEQALAFARANPEAHARIKEVLNVLYKYTQNRSAGAGSAGAQRAALYDKGRAEAVQQYGEAGVREAEAYNDLDDAQSAAFRQQNPEAYNRIKEVNRAIFKYLPSNYTGSTSRTTYSGGSSYSGGRSYSSGWRSYGSAPAAPVAPVTVTPQQPAQPEWQNWQESDFNARWQPLVDADPALPQLVNVLFGKDMLNVLRLWLKLTPEQRALWLQANPQLWAMLQRFMRWFMAQQVGKTGAGILLGSIPPNAPIPSATTVPPNAPYVPLPPAVPSAPAVANAGIPLPP